VRTFLIYLYEHPLFALTFLLSLIPFWVFPAHYLLNGADGELMFLFSILSLISAGYVRSQIYGICPWGVFYRYFLVNPFKIYFFTVITVLTLFLLITYASASYLDAGIAAVLFMYLFKLFFIRPSKISYLNVSGMRRYRLLNIFGQLFVGLVWLTFLSGLFSVAGAMLVALFAVIVQFSIFYKVNAGMA